VLDPLNRIAVFVPVAIPELAGTKEKEDAPPP
jgi:hypothetical protein